MMNGHYKIVLLLCGLLALTASCHDNNLNELDNNDENAVHFNTMVTQSESVSRAGLSSGYIALPAGYSLSVQMKSKVGETVSDIGTAKTYTVGTTGNADTPSTLISSLPLYWPDSGVTAYGFTASAGNDVVSPDQSSTANLISSDKLTGYSATDNSHTAIVYQTAKSWKSSTSTTLVPLYLEHNKAQITVILKAGIGVSHDALKYIQNNTAIKDTIFSYGATTDKDVKISKPYAEAATIDYSESEKGVSTTKFTAIVEPYDYYTNSSKTITRIVLNNQNYTFSASNDNNTDATAKAAAYNLTAGKHLILTVSLGRDGRIIAVMAQIRDWVLVANEDLSTDDFGHAVNPIVITSATELYNFLNSTTDNSKGNIAIFANNITLTNEDATKISAMTLNATLNLDGKVLSTPKTLLTGISSTGVLKYGTIDVTAASQTCAAVTTNNGIVDMITTESTGGHVLTKAGLVEINNATIKNCTNNIIVSGTDTSLGGIASTSTGTIDNCVNNSKVMTTNSSASLGGIVGTASGTVTNNTYAYGITQSQTTGKNIIGSGSPTTASGNSWPTKAVESIAGTNAFANPFTAVIDNETELSNILSGASTDSYRIAAGFSITADSWKDNTYELKSTLDGNNKTISSKYRLFKTITGTLKNTTIMLTANLASVTTSGGDDGMSAIALSLTGGTLDGITVTRSSDQTITASNPSGLVGVAKNATIANCINKVPLVFSGGGTIVYAGGIVSEAKATTISGCRNVSAATITIGNNTGNTTYVGGIAGVLNKASVDSQEACTVTDCTNFCAFAEGPTYRGGIIGLATANGVTATCQGNWWPTKYDGVGSGGGSIGKKNTIQPTE